ncbi:MAG: hypothetical protein LRZ99_05135 [Desulfotomaculum sp.]|nr:hypothetical protein [Desulfotomaculum sp.]MCL0080879.1 hypothetical protein [Peptococcaceae bacterium]
MSQRCTICAKLIVPEDSKSNDLWEDDFITKPKKQSTLFCQLCEAKLRKEADGIQKPRKSI